MSKVKIQGNASGTGVVTLTAPNTNKDRTITLPDGDISLGVGIDDNATSTAITIDASENVGVGTSSPQGKTHIKTASNDGNVADWADGQFLVSPGETSRSTGFAISVDTSANVSYLTSLTPSSAWRDLGYRALDHIFYGNGSTERMRITSDGRGLSQFTAKAWCYVIGTTIQDSHNVSSFIQQSTGKYYMNFSNNLGNSSYCATVASQQSSSNSGSVNAVTSSGKGVSRTGIIEHYESNVLTNISNMSVLVFGD